MSLVWLDGDLTPRETASVSIDDLGFLYGAACFETMRASAGVAFRLERHLDRMEAGLRLLGVSPPARATLRQALQSTLEANGLTEARVRLTVSAGRGSGRPDLAAPPAATVLVVVEPLPAPPDPARLIVGSQRLDELRPLREAKTANYLPSLLALAEARRAGCDDALLLNRRGRVAETATANLFAVIDQTLVTPPLGDGPLPGVTREAVLECARSFGLTASEQSITLDHLSGVAELFLTSSVVGVRAVSEIAGRWRSEACPGAVTSALAAAYDELVSTECEA